MEDNEKVMRNALADVFDLLSRKVRNGTMTSADLHSVLSSLEAGGGVKATIRELADYYGKTDTAVRTVIHRYYLPKPERRVYYDFGTFRRIVPKSWHPKH